jgi:amino acid adenylation domain-containing protein
MVSRSRSAGSVVRGAALPDLPLRPTGAQELGDWLVAWVAANAGIEVAAVDRHRSITSYGFDSLAAVELAHALEARLGVALPLDLLLAGPTLAEVAEVAVAAPVAAAATGPPAASSPAPLAPAGEPAAAQPYPLTVGQQGLLFLQQLAPDSAAHHIAVAARLSGRLDVERLRRACQELVGRHPALRSTFAATQAGPTARAHPRPELGWDEVEAAGWSDEAVAAWLVAAARQPFDLERGPLLRVALLSRKRRPAALLLTVHHLVADFWSLAVMTRELQALYTAPDGPAAAVARLPALPCGPAEHARAEAEMLAGAEGRRLRDFWHRQLAGDLPVLELPLDRPRNASAGGTGRPGAAVRLRLASQPAAGLRALARRQGATLYAGLLAAFTAFLHRYSRQADLVIGSPFAGRRRAAVAGLVGYLVNLLPLRADLDDEVSFAALVERSRDLALGALAHQEYPLARLVEQLRLVREPGCPPLFQAVLVLQGSLMADSVGAGGELARFAMGEPGARLRLGDATLESLPVELGAAEFDLTLTAAAGAVGEIALRLQYAADVFDQVTAERMLGHFATLLGAAARTPAAQVSDLPLLAASERRQLIARSRQAAAPSPDPGGHAHSRRELLHDAFARQAARRSAAVAVTCGEERLTYAELDRRANRLAWRLRAAGVGPEVLVGLCCERSVATVVAILGILKAGGAYVPMDPGVPRARLQWLLADCGAPVLLAPRALGEIAAPLAAERLLLWLDDDDDAAGSAASDPVPDPGVTDAHLAYVIYTSGSTGEPKGVAVPHRQVARLFSATAAWCGFGAADVWTLFHSFTFDFSVWEIWGALLHGGRLVVVPHAVSRAPDAFHQLLVEQGVTVLNQTPSAFRQLLGAGAALAAGGAGRLRWIVFGGEALDPRLLGPWFAAHGDRRPRLVNMYGITETTVHVTWRPLAAADAAARSSPIGEPIADLQLYLLDRRGEPVPPGVPGEIHVGGAGLARGYLRRPGQTATHFVPDPFSGSPGERLYRSGDLARRLSGGSLQFLGRIDQQLKIRGFRIEPGEIEAALRGLPGIRDAVVTARRARSAAASPVRLAAEPACADQGDGGPPAPPRGGDLRTFLKRRPEPPAAAPSAGAGDLRLVAYLVTGAGAAPSIPELRRLLRERLPDYMVPAAWVRLEALPLTANGKLDLRALPEPDGARPELGQPPAPPSGPVEETLAGIWAEVLGLDQVGVDDNFFELGGDSIRSIQVRARAKARGLDFTLQELLERQTVRDLARGRAWDGPAAAPGDPAAGPDGEPPAGAGGTFAGVAADDRAKLPAGLEDAYPLARIQAGVIFHSQSDASDPMYHDIFLYHLHGRFDLAGWCRAVQHAVDRHAILRTSFDLTRYREPLQLVHPRLGVEPAVVDLRALAPATRRAAQQAWIAAEKRRCFDWGRAPLIRFFLHRLEDDETQLVLSFHDAILDGWSTALLLTELLRDYLSGLAGEPAAPALRRTPPRVRFRDFVVWERAAIASPRHRAFWDANLSGCSVTPLPRWRRPRPGAVADITVLEVPVTAELSDRLVELGRQAGVPLKHVLLAAHCKVMELLAGHPDVLTGVESNGRLEVEDGELVLGMHLNSLPFRLQVPPGSWLELLRATLDAERRLLPFRRYPLAEMQRRRGGEPLFEAVFNYTHFHVFQQLQGLPALEIGGARGFGETHFALRVEFNRDPFAGHVQLDLECDREQLPPAQLAEIGGLFARTLAAMTADPACRHEGLSGLSAASRQQVLVEWQGAPQPPPCGAPVHRLIERQARLTPGAPALAAGDGCLTYRELNGRANQLARWLRSQGIGPGRRVGVLAERSLDPIVAFLAVLKAGAAYVPLDPEYPAAHLAAVVADAGLALLLTQERLAAGGGRPWRRDDPPAAWLDAAAPPWAGEEADDLEGGAGADDLAYLIYTSGSTGSPKGVEVTHRNLASSTRARFLTYDEPIRAFLLAPSLAFDSSVAGLYWTLCGGGTLVLTGPGGVHDLRRLTASLARHAVSHLLCIPSLWSLLLDASPAEELRSLTTVIVAGEACLPELPERHRRRLPRTALWNEYGPTEATVWATVARCDTAPFDEPVTIGRAIPNTRAYLLTCHQEPVPPGVTGELYLGGDGVARGYLGRSELTAERFLPDPWSEAPGGRLYRTGDLGRHVLDGRIELLGRADAQIKIRGFRVEPGEIEQALCRHAAVREAAVVALDDPRGGKQLVAFLAPHAGGSPGTEPEELRAFLASRLPSHMVPRRFVQLAALPRTPSGKLDRAKLLESGVPATAAAELAEMLQQIEMLSSDQASVLLAAKRGDPPQPAAVVRRRGLAAEERQ